MWYERKDKSEEEDMVHVTKIQHWDFELPNRCVDCPMRTSEPYGNATIESCLLKNNKNWVDNTIVHSRNIYPNTRQYFRDKNCPAKDGQSYTI